MVKIELAKIGILVKIEIFGKNRDFGKNRIPYHFKPSFLESFTGEQDTLVRKLSGNRGKRSNVKSDYDDNILYFIRKTM